MEFKLTSSKEVIYKVVRDLGLGDKEIPWQDYLEYMSEALQQIDAYTQYEEVIGFELDIENHIAKLPCNFYSAIANPNLAYKIQGDCIITEKKNGKICFNYLAFIEDEEGFLMIPDNISYREAILWKIAYKESMRGNLPNTNFTPQYCQAKWNFYCTQARSKGNSLGADAIERFSKNRLSFGRMNNYNYQNKFSKFDGLKDYRNK
jgi:hypothetical protein